MGTRPTRRTWGLTSSLLALALAWLAAATQPAAAAASPGCGSPVTPGATTHTAAGRPYLLVVPPGLDPNVPTPVIMGFHGGSDTAANANRYMGLTSDEPYLYVYPQAAPLLLALPPAWIVDRGSGDYPYVEAVLADLKATHCVDSSRVFAVGKSNGAFFVNGLVCLRPDLFRALVSVGGGAPQFPCADPPRAYMGIHGRSDGNVPISTGYESRDYWLGANGYSGAPPRPYDPPPCVSYPGTRNPVVWCEFDGAHDWPDWAGAAIRRFFRAVAPPPASPAPGSPASPQASASGDRTAPRATSIALGARSIGLRISEPAAVRVQVFRCRTKPARAGKARVSCAKVRPSLRRRGVCRRSSGTIALRAVRPGRLAASLCRPLPAGRYVVKAMARDPAGNRRTVHAMRMVGRR